MPARAISTGWERAVRCGVRRPDVRRSDVRIPDVHHDAARMVAFEARLGTARERFFSDAAPACAWLIFD